MTLANPDTPYNSEPDIRTMQHTHAAPATDEHGTTGREGWEGQRVLVTGGEGFIGSHLTERLVSAGALVTVVDRVPRGSIQNLKPWLERIEYLPRELVQVEFDELLAVGDYRSVFHLAGSASVPASVEQPWEDFQRNVVCTLKLMESLRRSGHPARLVIASSAAVYGDAQTVPISEDAPAAPMSPYGVSKLATDRYAAVYAQVYGLRTASLRPFAVYGPRLRKQVVYDFIRKLSDAPSHLEAHGDGTQVRDFCYVSDVVEAALAVACRGPLRGEAYNIASGVGTSIGRLLEQLTQQLGIQPRICWSGTVRPGEPQRWIADITRLKKLGWIPSVSLDAGLRRTLDWFHSSGY